MFMLFFACMSAISPPVAPAAFAAGAIAGANPFTIGWLACKYAIGGFVLPFMFVHNNGILLQGDPLKIVTDIALAVMLMFTSALALHGSILRLDLNILVRLIFAALSAAILWPDLPIQLAAAGTALVLFLPLYAWARWRKAG